MKTIAFVPARGGSKSIKSKNIKKLGGIPLIAWVLNALESATTIDQVVVATDDEVIRNTVLGLNLNKVVVFDRSSENATDVASTESVMLEYLNTTDLPDDSNFILVQATSPFTKSTDFDAGVKQYIEGQYDSMLSCARLKRFVWNEDFEPMNYDYRARPRRQDFTGSLIENGAFYINTVGNIKQHQNRLSGKIGIYTMSEYTALELDEPDDWYYAEQMIKKHHLSDSLVSFEKIKLVLTDLDGVLTDAGMYYSENGDELKKFSTYDGMAFELLRKHNILVGIMTSEDRALNQRRANKLQLDYIFQGVKNKLDKLSQLCNELQISFDQVAYIGDDINDLEILNAVGFPVCPSNARPEIKAVEGIMQLESKGGSGVVREFVDKVIHK